MTDWLADTDCVGYPPSTGNLTQLYVNQYVSSALTWREAGIQLNVTATMYAPGESGKEGALLRWWCDA
jgi:hypothetical protein